LAIFSCLKNIPSKEVLVNLKKSLRPFYKKAAREVMNNKEELDRIEENSLSTYSLSNPVQGNSAFRQRSE
jgi:hypothetical protein